MHGTRSYSWLALSLFAACGDNPPPEGADASSTIDTTGDPTSPPDQSCDSGIYIGRLAPGDTCADHGTWHATPLGSTGLLAEFCEYTWSGDDPPDLTVLPGEADGVFGLAESCPRVIPQGDTTAAEAALRASVYDAYMTNVGRIELAALMGRPTIDPPWLTFVDTIPAGLIPSGKTANDIHGEVLQNLAAALLCGDAAPCPVRLQQSLGLPRLDLRREDHELGGHFGSPADLARGVDAAVRDWETHSRARLILALAVGWEPVGAYGPDLADTTLDDLLVPGDAPADLQAVLAALMRAACQDAWIIAAVGNATSEPCAQTGAVGPAMLQALPPPTVAQCEDARFPHALDLDPALPFVLSAGHVDLDGGAPGNARTAAPAALTAQGTAFPSRTGGEPSFTGSSLATTGVAAALAAVSTVYPELTRAAVLDSLRVDAPTGVNICRAVRRACEEHAVHSDTACPFCPDEATTAAASVSVAIDDVLAAGASLQLGAVYSSNASLGDNACGTATTLWPDVGDLPPPEPLDSWTTPMPKGPVCESCQIKIQDPPEKITVGLKLVGLTAAPYPLIIEVVTATGVERYALDPTKLAAGLNTIDIFPALPWSEIQQVRLQVPVRGLDGRWYMRSEPLLPATPRANPEPPDDTTGDEPSPTTGDVSDATSDDTTADTADTGSTTEGSTTTEASTSADETSSTTEPYEGTTTGSDTITEFPDCGCVDLTVPLNGSIFLLSSKTELWIYIPGDAIFESIGIPNCNLPNPTSLTVDRQGFAWIQFAGGELRKVSLANPTQCLAPWPNQDIPDMQGIQHFGMTFAMSGMCEQLYGNSWNGLLPPTEAPNASEFFTLSPDGLMDKLGTTVYNGSELTGTEDGRLFLFGGADPAKIVQIDKSSGATMATINIDHIVNGDDKLLPFTLGSREFAFAFFAGDFYLFTSSGADEYSTVAHLDYDDSDVSGQQELRLLATESPALFVGASASTCAPIQPQ